MNRKNKVTIAYPREAAMALHWLDGMHGVRKLGEGSMIDGAPLVYVTGFDSQDRQTWAWINADVWNKWKGETK